MYSSRPLYPFQSKLTYCVQYIHAEGLHDTLTHAGCTQYAKLLFFFYLLAVK